MWNRKDDRSSTINITKPTTIGPTPMEFWPEAKIKAWAGSTTNPPTVTDAVMHWNQKYGISGDLVQKIKDRYGKHAEPNTLANDVIGVAATTAIPAGRIEEWIAAMVEKMMPTLEKAWPKTMAKFADLLKKSKWDPKALESIYAKFNEHPFVSKPVWELEGKAKIDAWLEAKPAYQRKAMNERAKQADQINADTMQNSKDFDAEVRANKFADQSGR